MCLGLVQRTGTNSKIKRYIPNGERKGVQCMCSVHYDVWQRDMAIEDGGYASSGKSTRDDDQMDEWSDLEEQKNK